jgi:stage V sporulation protein D (sporulation-specific penicillin-binding protein)
MGPNEKRKKVNALNGDMFRVRIIVVFGVVVLTLVLLGFRIGWIQVVATDTYAAKAQEMQQKDVVLPAQRGAILDRNMEELAVSTGTFKVYLRLKPLSSDNTDPKVWQEEVESSTQLLSTVLEIPREELDKKISEGDKRISVAKKVEKARMSAIRDAMEVQGLRPIEIEENPDRQYPRGAFAAHVLGMINAEGVGTYGVEKSYDEYLSGIAGRRISSTDAGGNPISYGKEKTYNSMDGMNVVLTLDATMQYYVEEAAEATYNENNAEKVEILIMDPSSGDILAMASYPDFDPNNPGVPLAEKQLEEFNALESAEEQNKYVMSLWKNPIISDLYEPGSVFKLVTAASAIEDGLITPKSTFVCKGSYIVAGQKINCWIKGAHGVETVPEALKNSCNPAMMQIVEKMKYERYYQYLDLFGMSSRTGIDLPGEEFPILQTNTTGPVERANMSFGMGLSITPLQMADAVSAIVNNGVLMQPRVVKGLADAQGNLVTEFPTTEIRTVISKATADEIKDAMGFISTSSTSDNYKIPGYNIGIKTGTSQKLIDGVYSKGKSLNSAVLVAPIDDKPLVAFLIVDTPAIDGYASAIAVPPLRDLMEIVLRYRNIKPQIDTADALLAAKDAIKVPDLTGKTLSEATEILANLGLACSGEAMNAAADPIIADQYPKAGAAIVKGYKVYVYGE